MITIKSKQQALKETLKKALNEIIELEYNLLKQKSADKEIFKNLKTKSKCESEIILDTIRLNNCASNDKPEIFGKSAYTDVLFYESKYGGSLVLKEDDLQKFEKRNFLNCVFINCKFDNLKFSDCQFLGCEFHNCTFRISIFDSCKFQWSYSDAKQDENLQIPTIFTNCNIISSPFRNCFCDNIIFKACGFDSLSFENTTLENSSFVSSIFHTTKFINSNINKFRMIDTKRFEALFRISSEKDVIIDSIYLTHPDIKNLNYNKKDFYFHASKMYKGLKTVMEDLSINDEVINDLSYHYNKYSFHTHKHIVNRSIGWLSWRLCGFGDRMGRFGLWLFAYIFLFSSIYFYTGIKVDGKPLNYDWSAPASSISEALSDFGQCISFSVVTFSTVGYGNVVPTGWSVFFSSIQMVLGIGLIAIFTAMILKKIIK